MGNREEDLRDLGRALVEKHDAQQSKVVLGVGVGLELIQTSGK